MKVICINGDWTGIPGTGTPSAISPIKDQVYTVIDDVEFQGVLFYMLEEIPNVPEEQWWDSRLFRPLETFGEATVGRIEQEIEEEELQEA